MTDLISRQAAIDAIRRYCIDNQIEDGDYHSDGIEYELYNLPFAEPKPCDFCANRDDCEDMKIYCPARGKSER